MEENLFPKDENLRLILSTDQEQWLRKRIRDWTLFSWVMTIILLLSMAWMTADAMGAFSRYDAPDCISFVGSSLNDQQQRDEIASSDLQPCPPQAAENAEINWEQVRGLVSTASWLLMMLTILGLLRGLFQLRTFKGYLQDHRAFLKKYNRL